MYTATITGKSIQRANRQVVVDVTFTDGVSEFTHKFNFGFDVSFDQIKKEIKRYAKSLEDLQQKETEIQNGEIDFTTVTESTATQTEIDRNEWFQAYRRLESVERLISLSVLDGTETPVVNLRNKVKADFQPDYVNYM